MVGYYGLFTLETNTHGGGEPLKVIALGKEAVFLTTFGVVLSTFVSLHCVSVHANSLLKNWEETFQLYLFSLIVSYRKINVRWYWEKKKLELGLGLTTKKFRSYDKMAPTELFKTENQKFASLQGKAWGSWVKRETVSDNARPIHSNKRWVH